ncbi:MAG: hypothetical protein ABIE84_02275 [bacterium]
MKKENLMLAVGVGLIALGFGMGMMMIGCGSLTGTNSGTTTSGNYSVSGSVGTITTSGIMASATDTVTDIVAIGADNEKTLVTPEADGSFVLTVTSGQPYVLGFYNKTGTTITLLGYLQNSDYDWDSLPIIAPADSATALGTIEIDTASLEATPAIDITSLITEMDMDTSVATLYGELDNSLASLTNIDIDGNGVFDFTEDKNYMFQTYIGMFDNDAPPTGEVDAMISGYNSDYTPIPSFLQIYFTALGSGDVRDTGTTATLTPPSALGGTTTQTTTTDAISGSGFTLFFPTVSTPEIAPDGTYSVVIESTTYTINNFKASEVMRMGADNNIIYPVFHLVSNESTGKIETVQYKWQKLVNGATAEASAAEVLAAINFPSSESQKPFISFFSSGSSLHREGDTATGKAFYYLTATPADLTVSGLDIDRADIHHIQAGYEFTSRVVVKFDLY